MQSCNVMRRIMFRSRPLHCFFKLQFKWLNTSGIECARKSGRHCLFLPKSKYILLGHSLYSAVYPTPTFVCLFPWSVYSMGGVELNLSVLVCFVAFTCFVICDRVVLYHYNYILLLLRGKCIILFLANKVKIIEQLIGVTTRSNEQSFGGKMRTWII